MKEGTDQFKVTKRFVLAGKAIFTCHNDKGVWFTYKVVHKPADKSYPENWFVSLLVGPDNNSQYAYLGILSRSTGQVILTKKSCRKQDHLSVKVLNWAMKVIWEDRIFPDGYGCHGEGRCGRCGRRLTAEPGVNPEGFRFGFGPICWEAVGGVNVQAVNIQLS